MPTSIFMTSFTHATEVKTTHQKSTYESTHLVNVLIQFLSILTIEIKTKNCIHFIKRFGWHGQR